MAPCTPQTSAAATPLALSERLSGVEGQGPSAAAAALLLDLLQTTSHVPAAVASERYPTYDVNPDWIPFEHTGWHNVRMKVFDAMKSAEVPPARVCKFLACGDETYVYQNAATGEIDYHGSRCGDRFCLICGQVRSRRIARSLEPRLQESQPLFITLTIRGTPGDRLANLIDRLNAGWKELRRLKHWQERIDGGAIMLEIKYSRTSGGHWHPHYHLLCHGRFIEQQWLRDAWKLITRDSDQVDVQRVTDLPKAIGYVVKYASKPMDSSFTMVPALLREAIKSLKGRRLCACFGSWYGTPLNDSPEVTPDETEVLTQWRFVGTRRDLAFRAERGDTDSINLLAALDRVMQLRHSLIDRCTSPPKVCVSSISPELFAA